MRIRDYAAAARGSAVRERLLMGLTAGLLLCSIAEGVALIRDRRAVVIVPEDPAALLQGDRDEEAGINPVPLTCAREVREARRLSGRGDERGEEGESSRPRARLFCYLLSVLWHIYVFLF